MRGFPFCDHTQGNINHPGSERAGKCYLFPTRCLQLHNARGQCERSWGTWVWAAVIKKAWNLQSKERPCVSKSISSSDRKCFPVVKKAQGTYGKKNCQVHGYSLSPSRYGIEKKTRELVWLLSAHSCTPLWNKRIFPVFPISNIC